MKPNVGHHILAFGNNVASNLSPNGTKSISQPTKLDIDCEKIIWHSWTCTILRDSSGIYHSWGIGAPRNVEYFSVKKVLGVDTPSALLHADGRAVDFNGNDAKGRWDEATVTGLGTVYASKGEGIRRWEGLVGFINDAQSCTLSHPFLTLDSRLYATESRCLVHTTGNVHHLLELVDVKSLPPSLAKTKKEPVFVRVLEEFEGLGIKMVVPGSSNRFGVITDVGDAYILSKDGETELLEFGDDEVRLMGVGSNFEVVVTDTGVYSRGSSKFIPCELTADG